MFEKFCNAHWPSSLQFYLKETPTQLFSGEYCKLSKNFQRTFVTDNKLFWKTIKPFFSDKGNYGDNIKLVEEEQVLQNDSEIAEQLNVVSTLGITENSFIINKEYENISEPVQRAILKFESHPSISLIKNKITNENNFKFEPVSLSDIELEIRLLNPKKATTHKNIPPKILKSSSEATVNVLHRLFNETITKGVFPNNLKLADVTPVFKKDDPFDKKNYRPVSVLPTISKIYEKLMQKQINNYITNYLSPYLCGYRKGIETPNRLWFLS